MDLFQALILGLVQGVTEYIPISSSAHLGLVPWLLGWHISFAFYVLVQWGTLVGVFIFFWPDIWAITRGVMQGLWQGQPVATFEARLGWLVVLATIPAVILGLLFEDFFEATFSAPIFDGSLLIVNALILVVAERYGAAAPPGQTAEGPPASPASETPKRKRDLTGLTWLDATIIGLWQAVAILPAISRSGATIGGAVLRGFDRPAAARFSFLMSIPALAGAGLVALRGLLEAGMLTLELPAISIGFVAAAISGYFCIRWLLRYLQSHSLYIFAAYCAIFGLIVILVATLRG
jgi:undecaprenyl-diphosphatase